MTNFATQILDTTFSRPGLDEFRRLVSRQDLSSYVSAADVEYLKSLQYLLDVATVADDAEKRAKLTICLLEHFALDPHRGSKVEDFLEARPRPYEAYDGATTYLWVSLAMHKMAFFVESFSIPHNSPYVALLKQAVQANLQSKKFKAARMSRRLAPVYSRIYAQLDNKAQTAAHTAYRAAYDGFKQDRRAEITALQQQTLNDIMSSTYRAVMAKPVARMDARMARVDTETLSEAFTNNRGFTGILAAFAATSIREVAQELVIEGNLT